jgi:hypothetical protein
MQITGVGSTHASNHIAVRRGYQPWYCVTEEDGGVARRWTMAPRSGGSVSVSALPEDGDVSLVWNSRRRGAVKLFAPRDLRRWTGLERRGARWWRRRRTGN